ncbi:MAG: hypothetical protein V1754_11855 [Pseudomonadota bacterium]
MAKIPHNSRGGMGPNAVRVLFVLGAFCIVSSTTPSFAAQNYKSSLSQRVRAIAKTATKKARRVRHTIERPIRAVQCKTTQLADKLEAKLPRRYQKTFGTLRLFNPLGTGSYMLRKFKQDKHFLVGYGIASQIFSRTIVPALLTLGVDPVLAVGIRAITGNPVNATVLVLRQHYLNKKNNPSQTLGQTAKELAKEYRTHIRRWERRNRKYAALGRN